MSLNCLTCQGLQRTDSESESSHRHRHDHKQHNRISSIKVERSWSGNLSSPPYEPLRRESSLMPPKQPKKGHRRLQSTGVLAFEETAMTEHGEPKLIRSCGMRRDWSFENLKNIMKERSQERRQGRKASLS